MADVLTVKVPSEKEAEDLPKFLEETKKVINEQAKELADLKALVASLHP